MFFVWCVLLCASLLAPTRARNRVQAVQKTTSAIRALQRTQRRDTMSSVAAIMRKGSGELVRSHVRTHTHARPPPPPPARAHTRTQPPNPRAVLAHSLADSPAPPLSVAPRECTTDPQRSRRARARCLRTANQQPRAKKPNSRRTPVRRGRARGAPAGKAWAAPRRTPEGVATIGGLQSE